MCSHYLIYCNDCHVRIYIYICVCVFLIHILSASTQTLLLNLAHVFWMIDLNTWFRLPCVKQNVHVHSKEYLDEVSNFLKPTAGSIRVDHEKSWGTQKWKFPYMEVSQKSCFIMANRREVWMISGYSHFRKSPNAQILRLKPTSNKLSSHARYAVCGTQTLASLFDKNPR